MFFVFIFALTQLIGVKLTFSNSPLGEIADSITPFKTNVHYHLGVFLTLVANDKRSSAYTLIPRAV